MQQQEIIEFCANQGLLINGGFHETDKSITFLIDYTPQFIAATLKDLFEKTNFKNWRLPLVEEK